MHGQPIKLNDERKETSPVFPLDIDIAKIDVVELALKD
jgi:hypothetical protein